MARSDPDDFRIDIDLDHARREGDRVRDLLTALRRRHDLSRYEYTSIVRIVPGGDTFAQPVLTLGNRFAATEDELLSTYLHEQMHWYLWHLGTPERDMVAPFMDELVRRYPASPYAEDARLKIDLVRDHLAGKEMEIGRFYQRRHEWLASVIRFRAVVDEFQTTSHTPEALMRLTESYLALGIPEEARRSAAVLGANYPDTEWYQRAYELVERNAPQQTAAAAPEGTN